MTDPYASYNYTETAPPGYASDPQLTMLWTSAPSYTGNVGPAQGSGSAPLDLIPIMVDLGSVMFAENGLLFAVSGVVNAYNPLDQQVQAAVTSDSFFGQEATYDTLTMAGQEALGPQFQNRPDVDLQPSARQFADQINPAMTRVLRMIADAAESVGIYIAMLDKAGQAYSAADISTELPKEQSVATDTATQ